MDLNKLARRAKETVDKSGGVQGLKEAFEKRGGTEGLKEDVSHLRDIARQPGSMSEKAKQAAEALRRPGPAESEGAETPPPDAEVVEDAPMAEGAGSVHGADEVETPEDAKTADVKDAAEDAESE